MNNGIQNKQHMRCPFSSDKNECGFISLNTKRTCRCAGGILWTNPSFLHSNATGDCDAVQL